MYRKHYKLLFVILTLVSFSMIGYMYKNTIRYSPDITSFNKETNSQEIKIAIEKANIPDKIECEDKIVVETKTVVIPEKSTRQVNDFLKRYPFFLNCNKTYNPWFYNKTSNPAAPDNFDYSQPALAETHSLRITRAVLVYFPIEKSTDYMLEFKWLYRSWIEMQKFEPLRWRTDLIAFVDDDQTKFNDKEFFFNKLNCSFLHKRTMDTDVPMCTLLKYKSLSKREFSDEEKEKIKVFNLLAKKKQYESILHDFDIYDSENDQINLAPFYSLLKENLKTYNYLDSILMAFDGYNYFRSAGFDYLIRSDMDVFLTPLFGKWLPRHCNDFNVGRGGFSSGFNNNRLKRIADNLDLKYAEIWNLGSTWYSTPSQIRLVSYLTLFGMAYLSAEEFSQPEREGKLGTLLWPEWHYGVLLLYGQSLALNHLIESKQLNVNKLEDLIDFPSGNVESIFKKLHIHVFHGDDLFSKFVFKMGRYDNMTVSNENATLVKYYALKMALEGKKMSELSLVEELGKGSSLKM